jgi:hypothetical protein
MNMSFKLAVALHRILLLLMMMMMMMMMMTQVSLLQERPGQE